MTSPNNPRIRRHDLVTVRAGAHFEVPDAGSAKTSRAEIRAWIDAGRPLSGARQPDGLDGVRLGVTLPTTQARRRVGVVVAAVDIESVSPPPPLRDCVHVLDGPHASVLLGLADDVETTGASIRTYGSLCWESRTGEHYRHAASDVDVVCDVTNRTQFVPVIAALTKAQHEVPFNIDAEIRFPNGEAVAWQELSAHDQWPNRPLLARGPNDVGLWSLEDLLASCD